MFLSNLRRISERTWLVAIIVSYLGLAVAYSVTNPAFESPDEIHHYAYVDYVMRERHLPVAELGGPESEYHQPPLYYLLGALVAAPVKEAQNPYSAVERNPFWGWRIGQVGADNKNQYIHDSDEAWPYRDWALGLHLVRWLSVVLQICTLLATYLIGREIFPTQSAIRLGALAFASFLPQFLFVSASVSNDNLIVPLTALVMLVAVRLLGRGVTWSRTLLLGLLIGLAILTKMSALALLPLALGVVTVAGWRKRTWKQVGEAWAGILVPALGISAPIFIRNLRLYGEPTALRRMSEIWGQHDPPLSYAEALREAPNVWTSFWARFGYGQIPLPNAIYLGWIVVVALAMVGLVIWLLRERRRLARHTAWQLALLVIAGSLFVFLVINYVRVSLTGANGRFAFPALPAYGLLLFLGLSAWIPRRWHGWLAALAHGGMMAFAIIALIGYLRPAYAQPALQAEPIAPSHAIELRFGQMIALRGYSLDRDSVYPGDDLVVSLSWQGLTKPDRDYTIFVHLLGPNNKVVGGRDTYPGLGRFPTSQWRPGDLFVDRVTVPVQLAAAEVAPAALSIEVGLYDLVTGQRLPITEAAGGPMTFPIIGQVKLAPRTWPQVIPPVADRYVMGNEIVLLGYDLPKSARPGEELRFTLYWQALARPAYDYTVFVHLLDAAGTIVAQGDAPPMGGNYPTGLWAPPEMLADPHRVILPADLPSGEYYPSIGLYNLADGRRLPVLDEAGREVGDSVTLPAVLVGQGRS